MKLCNVIMKISRIRWELSRRYSIKKMDEEFKVSEEDGRKNLLCKITERGLFFYHSSYEAWWQDSGLLSYLLTGQAVIVDE